MEDIKAISRRLTLSNLIVFLIVLGIFGTSVFAYGSHQIAEQERISLSRLTDSVIASIDFKDEDEGEVLPDLLATTMSETESRSLSPLRLQYFSPKGKLLIERGKLKLDAPFNPANSLTMQDTPHALIQTKSASNEGHLLGFVRVATPLEDSDRRKERLLLGLFFGLIASMFGACVGTFWLVKQSLAPIQLQIQRLEKFTADAAHELRNPIAVVRTNSEVALKYRENSSLADVEKFETILDAAKQMQKLTEDLLALARGQRAAIPQEKEGHAIVDIITEVVTSILSGSNENQTEFKIESPASTEKLVVYGKRDEIERIIKNIIENAARYSMPSEVVTIVIESINSTVKVKVIDSGVGIAASDLPHIFDRFWRADRARNHHSGGNGLGLSIAATLAKQNNCSIDVQSELNKGSTFILIFPNSLPQ